MDGPHTLIPSLQDTRAEFFDEASRYRGLQLRLHIDADGHETVHVERRLLPPVESMAVVGWHTVLDDERLDQVAAQYFDDARLWWRVADANRVRVPALACWIGRRLALTLPPGVPGPGASGG